MSHLSNLLHFRHDWYQTESQVVVTIMVKNAKKEDVTVIFGEREVMFLLVFFNFFIYLFFCHTYIHTVFITDIDYFQVLHVEKRPANKIITMNRTFKL